MASRKLSSGEKGDYNVDSVETAKDEDENSYNKEIISTSTIQDKLADYIVSKITKSLKQENNNIKTQKLFRLFGYCVNDSKKFFANYLFNLSVASYKIFRTIYDKMNEQKEFFTNVMKNEDYNYLLNRKEIKEELKETFSDEQQKTKHFSHVFDTALDIWKNIILNNSQKNTQKEFHSKFERYQVCQCFMNIQSAFLNMIPSFVKNYINENIRKSVNLNYQYFVNNWQYGCDEYEDFDEYLNKSVLENNIKIGQNEGTLEKMFLDKIKNDKTLDISYSDHKNLILIKSIADNGFANIGQTIFIQILYKRMKNEI